MGCVIDKLLLQTETKAPAIQFLRSIRETTLFPNVTSRHNSSKTIPTLQNKMAIKN